MGIYGFYPIARKIPGMPEGLGCLKKVKRTMHYMKLIV